MPQFVYKAKKNPKEIIEGVIAADNLNSAIHKISGMGYFIISINEYTQSDDVKDKKKTIFQSKISVKDITNFTRQVSDLIESGLPIVRALDAIERQITNKKLRLMISDIKSICMEGNAFSSALTRYPNVFSNFYISLVRSGEASGSLEAVLKRLADFNEKQLDVQNRIKSALAYPILMAVVGVMTLVILFTFVLPRMVSMFGDMGQNLPMPTLILMSFNNFVTNYWWVLIAVLFLIYFIFSRAYRTQEGKRAIDSFKINMPIFGDLIKKVEIGMAARTLATLLNNGVPMLEALKVVSETVNNAGIKDELVKASANVKEGKNLAAGFQNTNIFPPLVISMIAVGEESGNVVKSLTKVSDTYDRETDSAVKVMLSLLEPAIILVMGLVVGFIVVAILLPIFEINLMAR